MKATFRPVTLQDYKRRMLRVLVHVQEHLDEPLPLEQLAEIACFSPYHFHRIFTGMIGESVKEHVRRLRLERAASRLKLGTLPVTQIAFEAGYDSLEAFSRSFRSAFSTSPSRFRAANRSEQTKVNNAGKASHHFNTNCFGGKNMKVRIEQRKPLRVAFMRHVGPYNQVGETWDKFLTFMGKEGLLCGNWECIGICHDNPEVTAPDKIRYDACASVDDSFQATGDIGVQVIAGGDYAVTTHFGPYNNLGRTYSKLMGEWIPRSGRELRSAPCFEVYLNDPSSTEPEELLTDIFAPLAA